MRLPLEHIETDPEITKLEHELSGLLNRYSCENPANTPDFILARYLIDCLDAYNRAKRSCDSWHGEDGAAKGAGPKEA